MRFSTSAPPARRTRRRTATIAAGLAVSILATAGVTATASASQPSASGSISHFALASYTVAQPVVPGTGGGTDAVSVKARQTLAAADDALTGAASVTSDIAASGLDIGVADASVDTSELAAAVARLAAARGVPTPLVPQLTEDLSELVAPVATRAADLRGRLDAAVQLKAEQEAAAKAQREAEEAAAAAAAAARAAEEAAAAEAAASAPASSSPSSAAPAAPAPSYASANTSAGEAQSIARGMLGGYGWGDDQFSCLVSLWNRESGWNTRAANPSGAYGIPQALPGSKMASAGADWQTSAATQIAWGFGYISGRYGTPCGAWSHSESVGWY
ncbi:lytic transglycosylase domain-containing protein [Microbacterium sp. P03]|uniref:aggregation-promoting factor C-terminal-like domain-containing protein n=1 Tax=Microbacterium sp. P03 TaxID=3366946 RepID=UPI00374588E3